MRTLVITQNVTLDGAIEMLGDWFNPQDQTPDLLEALQRFSAREDALLLGRRTFEDFRGYWPEQQDDATGITAILNRVPKFVVSSTIDDPGWQNSTVLGADWLETVGNLKAADGNEIGVTGSITLCHSLIEAGLVDEFRLFVYPAVQGRGRRLFPDGHEVSQLELLECRPFSNGVALVRYRMPSQARTGATGLSYSS